MSSLSDVSIPDSTHIVNFSIAVRTDWLGLSNRPPFAPRSRTLHTSAQANPSSTWFALLIVESCIHQPPIDQYRPEGTHSDGDKQNGGRTEHSLCWHDARGLLREIEGIDSYIQRGECIIPSLWSLGLGGHGRKSRRLREAGSACGLRKSPNPNKDERPSCHRALLEQTS